MSQDINFLKSVPKVPLYLPATWMALGLIALVVLLGATSASLSAKQLYLNKKLKKVTMVQKEATAAYQKVAAAYPMLAENKPLVERVADYEKQLKEKQEHFNEITHTTLRQPFSSYLDMLSTGVPEGLWLTNIKVDEGTDSVSISGYSLKPIYVSLLLKSMQASPVFKNQIFDLFYVKKIKDKDYLKFEIANNKLNSLDEKEVTDQAEPKK